MRAARWLQLAIDERPGRARSANTCGTSYALTVYANNANGAGTGVTASAVPKVSWVGDSVGAILTKAYPSGSCTSCHAGTSVAPDLTDGTPSGYPGAVSDGALMYECPAHDSTCSTSMTACTSSPRAPSSTPRSSSGSPTAACGRVNRRGCRPG